MSTGESLSLLRLRIMLALSQMPEGGTGVEVVRFLAQVEDRPTSTGSIYAALVRLHDMRLTVASLRPPAAKRGGRSRLSHRLTETGLRDLRDALDDLDRLRAIGQPGALSQ